MEGNMYIYINKTKPCLMKIEGRWKYYESGHLCNIEDIFNQLTKDSSEDVSKSYTEYQLIINSQRMSITMSNKGNIPIKLYSKSKTLVVPYKDIYGLYKIFDYYEGSIVTVYMNYRGKLALLSHETKSVIEL